MRINKSREIKKKEEKEISFLLSALKKNLNEDK